MATFKVDGLNETIQAYLKAEKIPQNIIIRMLKGMAEIARDAQKSVAARMGVSDTGGVIASITVKEPKVGGSASSIDVDFVGSRHRYNTTTKNAEIAFINEFGKKGQPARPFIKTANEEKGQQITQKAESIFDDWLKQCGF